MGLCKFSQNQGPWFGVGQWEGVNHWSLVRMIKFSVGGCQQWASQQIQAKSRTMVCHGSVGGCQPLVLG